MQMRQQAYANRFVAVRGDEVIAADESIATAIKEANRICPDRDYVIRVIQAEEIYFRYLTC
jgi:hypothetical protein